MDPYFESEPPFIVKVYDKHFEITWEGAMPVPGDKYLFRDVLEVNIIPGVVELTIMQRILDFFFHNALQRKIEAYDEVLIEFRNGQFETRYIHGKTTNTLAEAVAMINTKLNQREYRTL